MEAHDFPHPERDLQVDFANVALGATPEGWTVAHGNAAGMTVAAEGQQKFLRPLADREPLVGLYTAPWEAREMAAEFRLPAENRTGVGFVFGYVDAGNHGRVFLDAAAGAIRVSRFVNGRETVLTERKAGIALGEWLEIEIQTEGGAVEVEYDDTLEFTAAFGADIPPSPLGFQVPANSSAEFRAFTLEGEPRTPRVSIVSCPAYESGAATTDLLTGSAARFQAGAGLSLADRTPPWSGAGAHGEFEWALVVRRFADGAVTNEEGDTFELRMVEAGGAALGTARNPVLRLAIPPGHVGGTFVETPGRIGPWQAANGDLYFIMEPTETDNLFLMVKSADGGRTWREVDGANRPRTGDLESVDARLVGDTIHIIHQVTPSTRYHAFRTSDHPVRPDSWAVRDELAASADSVAQAATLAVRSDGSMVAFYVGQTIHYNVRSPAGTWGTQTILDADVAPHLAGPQAVLGAHDTVHLAYYGTDGTIWYRRLRPDGTLTDRQQLASGAGATRAEYGSVLPLVFIPQTNAVVVLYRLSDGKLWERRIVNDGPPTPASRVTDRDVVRDAVDSQQPGADAVLDGETVRVLFIEQSSRGIFSTHDAGGWQPSTLRVDNIRGSWIRGNVYTRPNGAKVYGYVYDAGSDGGAGMNRFGEVGLSGH
ncbi:MAG TPA: hypothetical protein VMT87_17015 [Vicinamibacteria bacterium]|nr:hypothetical protein [Vicinamibacteria bacterium]